MADKKRFAVSVLGSYRTWNGVQMLHTLETISAYSREEARMLCMDRFQKTNPAVTKVTALAIEI